MDHVVLTVRNLEHTLAFYEGVLGMERVQFGDGRYAVRFGDSKINLHAAGAELAPAAGTPTPGSADLCFVVDRDAESITQGLRQAGVEIVEGPVARTGALGPIESVYVRDPDGNLIELSSYA